jgi:dihydrodipicolinate synthase/N-acetylneuraminate lyase
MNTRRADLLARLFPDGIPTLWCPPLTHYTHEGAIDGDRIAAHQRFMAPNIGGLLVPGTTGDAWELTGDETDRVIKIALDVIAPTRLKVLLGAIHPEPRISRLLIEQRLAILRERACESDPIAAMIHSRVCGFALCPPRGADLSDATMRRELKATLEMGVPIALYQLPQFTHNEMSPELVSDLAAEYPNLILFKDTSGGDRVALAGLKYHGLFLTRGMEGEYHRWLKPGGGPYDGFLLSTANIFAAQLARIRKYLEDGSAAAAGELSANLSSAVDGLFQIVASVSGGNPFANANKLADHFFAHGPHAIDEPPPRLHSGPGLTAAMITDAGRLLESHQLMPGSGYLHPHKTS